MSINFIHPSSITINGDGVWIVNSNATYSRKKSI